MLHRDGLDLAQLNTETTQLDLIIRPTDEHQITVPVPTDNVTRAIHPGSRRTERIRDETLTRQTRTTPIPNSHTPTSNIQITH
ncbi:hypothetical protein AB0G97_23965, partial [Streptomyces sp. NPDC020755]|uniref:hypothetical protein n=1 Tax=Streptomyces sp. NPDC020755 TaxID=3154790 RepID=UPI0033E0F69A